MILKKDNNKYFREYPNTVLDDNEILVNYNVEELFLNGDSEYPIFNLVDNEVILFNDDEITKIKEYNELVKKESLFRTERNNLLSQVDIEINKGLDNGIDVSALRAYRQELRDATVTWVLPTHP